MEKTRTLNDNRSNLRNKELNPGVLAAAWDHEPTETKIC